MQALYTSRICDVYSPLSDCLLTVLLLRIWQSYRVYRRDVQCYGATLGCYRVRLLSDGTVVK